MDATKSVLMRLAGGLKKQKKKALLNATRDDVKFFNGLVDKFNADLFAPENEGKDFEEIFRPYNEQWRAFVRNHNSVKHKIQLDEKAFFRAVKEK